MSCRALRLRLCRLSSALRGPRRSLRYVQGQNPDPQTREYFYYIDHQGQETADNMSKRAVADAKVAYAHAEAYSNGQDAEAYAEAGICKAEVEAGMFSAGANLLNASAGAKDTRRGAGAMARAELASVSAGVGPVKVKAGLGVDTGIKAGNDGLEVKVLGTGLNLGSKPSISVLGSEAECIVM